MQAPTPAASVVIPKLSSTPVATGVVESVPNVVCLVQSACAVKEPWTVRLHFDTVTLDNDRRLTSTNPLLNV